VFCDARSIGHVGDLYPACSFSSVCLVSSWMIVISTCSRSNHRFRKKIQLLFAIVYPLCGSMHVLRPSVVLILDLSRHSSQANDSSRILTYPLFGCGDGMNHTCPTLHSTHLLHILLSSYKSSYAYALNVQITNFNKSSHEIEILFLLHHRTDL